MLNKALAALGSSDQTLGKNRHSDVIINVEQSMVLGLKPGSCMVLGLKPMGKLITIDNYLSVRQNQGLA